MINKLKKILTVVFCAAAFIPAVAKITVTAKLDSANLLMGSLTTLNLEVVQNKGQKGGFPLLQGVDPSQGYVGVCGDSVELRTSFTVDTVELGSGRVQFNYKVPVQAFDSGAYRLPEFVYVSEGDSARSNAVTLNVMPMKVTEDDPIAGFAPVAEPEGKKFLDIVPDWMADLWWVIVLVILAAGVTIWALRRYKKEGTVLRKAPEPTPYELAVRELRDLKTKKLWEQGMEKEYFTRLTDILRQYLQGRFGINAMEMTTREIMDTLRTSDVKDKREYVRQILNVADFVKFAKVRPLPADSIAAYDNALNFVEETKPQPVENEENKSVNTESAAAQKKGGEK